jgi:hypothetical protein
MGSPVTRTERALLVLTPFACVGAVALGLRVGSPRPGRVAEVFGAPGASAGAALSWEIAAEWDESGARTPLSGFDLAVTASRGPQSARAFARTNADGVAEVLVASFAADADRIEVTTRDGGVLAVGRPSGPPAGRLEPPPAPGPWMPVARRTGALWIDVSLLGGRAAPGFAATICARVLNARTREPAAGVDVRIVDDPSVRDAASGRTDDAGWVTLHATPVGLAIALELLAIASDGQQGDWVGGLVAAPGGAAIHTRARWSPEEAPEVDVIVPTARATYYVEIDDDAGRAWATALDLSGDRGHAREVTLRVPELASGVYWVVASSLPGGAQTWAPSTTVRPFFVAKSDEAAFALRRGSPGCEPRRTSADAETALSTCLASVTPRTLPRWTVVDGPASKRQALAGARGRGRAIALGAVVLATLLELWLLARASFDGWVEGARIATGAKGPGAPATAAAWMAVALFVALLGFALLAAFLAFGA